MNVSLHQVAALLNESKNIVITVHLGPDGDAMGSMIALYLHLKSLDKNVEMVIDDDCLSYLKFLPGFDCVKKFDESMSKTDLLVVVDASSIDRIGKVVELIGPDTKLLNIDHHISNTLFADYTYLDVDAAASGEIILDLLEQENAFITKEIATCLFTAIATDCGFFKFANTTPKALLAAAKLVECGAKPYLISDALRTKPLEYTKVLADILNTLEVYDISGFNVAAMTVEKRIIKILQNDTEELIDFPRNVLGTEFAILYKEMADNEIKVSFRSKKLDVSAISLSLGGGGHKRAAGCTLHLTLEEARKKIDQAIADYLKNVK